MPGRRTTAADTTVQNKPKKITSKQFISQYVKTQIQLLDGMLQCISEDELAIDEADADEVIDNIIGEWSSDDDPDFMLQMKMTGALFLDELLEHIYAQKHGVDVSEPGEHEAPANTNHPGVTITLDVLKTVRSIWGKRS